MFHATGMRVKLALLSRCPETSVTVFHPFFNFFFRLGEMGVKSASHKMSVLSVLVATWTPCMSVFTIVQHTGPNFLSQLQCVFNCNI